MYNYEDIYDKIIKKTQTVNLSDEESLKIIDKIYNDLNIGILKPRNINKKCSELICNSILRQNNGKENINLEKYQIKAFINKLKPKLDISDEEIEELKEELENIDEISTENLNKCLKQYLAKINNHSLMMIKNQDFRVLNNSVISVENPKFAKKLGIFDDCVLLYGFIDHNKGLLFELLMGENEENLILTKKDIGEEVITSIDKEDFDDEKYSDIRNLVLLDDFRDSDNPDIIKALFIKNHKREYLRVKLERKIGSNFIGYLIDEPKDIEKLTPGSEVIVSYAFDYTDNVHVYINYDDENLPKTVRHIEYILDNPSKEIIIATLANYKYDNDFDLLVDIFHNIIFEYFKDINEFYDGVFGGVGLCI